MPKNKRNKKEQQTLIYTTSTTTENTKAKIENNTKNKTNTNTTNQRDTIHIYTNWGIPFLLHTIYFIKMGVPHGCSFYFSTIRC